MNKPLLTVSAAVLLGLGVTAQAAEYQVKMLNSGADGTMVFEPAYLKVSPGDTVTFVAADPGHNSASVHTPGGAEGWNGPIGQEVSVTLDQEGVYLYQCAPHVMLGMVGVVQVGEPVNLEAAQQAAKQLKSRISLNKSRLDQYLGQVQ